MKQTSFAVGGFEKHMKGTRRAVFLSEMNRVLPWAELCALIEPHYPKAGNGRPPMPLELMIRIHCLQHWFNLSDPAAEEALYDSVSMRQFAGIDLGEKPVPDETTICKFRHLLERHGLGQQIFELIGRFLDDHGLKVSRGTIVDASVISAPSSTKNQSGERDPEMGSTKKGRNWLFGMKAHIGVDSKTKRIHSVEATPANLADCKMMPRLLHGQERRVWGDTAYIGQRQVIRQVAPNAQDFTQIKATRHRKLTRAERLVNRTKSKVRAKVEHAFGVIKQIFGFRKVRYRGIYKNANRLMTACALANVYMFRRLLIHRQVRCV